MHDPGSTSVSGSLARSDLLYDLTLRALNFGKTIVQLIASQRII